ncbi:hypothetical protein GJ496_010339 [Pomphorhynchus laevis]|nr:hypothetical protein GJ496_010339 [Pomphorhynchus laevis]
MCSQFKISHCVMEDVETGSMVIEADGSILSSFGELENNSHFAENAIKLVSLGYRLAEMKRLEDNVTSISVTIESNCIYSFVALEGGKYLIIVRRKSAKPESLKC